MKESDLLMTSLPPRSSDITADWSLSQNQPIELHRREDLVYDLACGGNSSDKFGRSRVLKEYCARPYS